MSEESNVLDVEATAQAAALLAALRLRHSNEIPLPVWRMLTRAEAKLSREIEDYFRAPKEGTVGEPTRVPA